MLVVDIGVDDKGRSIATLLAVVSSRGQKILQIDATTKRLEPAGSPYDAILVDDYAKVKMGEIDFLPVKR